MGGVVGLLVFSFARQADAFIEKKDRYNQQGTEYVLGGYDVTAYWTFGEARMGTEEISSEYDGATYLFHSQAAKHLFEGNPMRYIPAYHGYCATAVSAGYTAPVKADTAWLIHNDRLYLNFSDSVHRTWLKHKESRIMKANENWPEVLANLGWGLSNDTQEFGRSFSELGPIDSIREKLEGWLFSEESK